MPYFTVQEAIEKLEHLEEYIDKALKDNVAEVAKEEISTAALYWDGGGGIADKSVMEDEVSNMTLKITDNAQLQNLWSDTWSADVAAIVQSGSKQFNQPFPRPFMKEAIKDAINLGIIDQALKDGIRSNGLDVD